MRLPIGKVIYGLRKEMSVTQEQLASSVGVSVPAVSKWESGQAYPDITLLPSIARYFNTSIDNLLKYEVNLSNEEVMTLVSQCAEFFEAQPLDEAVAGCERYLYQYPNNLFLKLRTASLYMTYIGKAKDSASLNELALKAIRLLEQAAQSSEMEICHSANYLLATVYSLIGEGEKAEQTLGRLPKNLVNPEDMLVPLYTQQKRFEEARKLLQTNMYGRVQHISQALVNFAVISQQEGKVGFAVELLQMQRQFAGLFKLDSVNILPSTLELLQLSARQQESQKTLAYAEEIAGILQPLQWEEMGKTLRRNSLFDLVSLMEPLQSTDYMRKNLVQILESSEIFDFVREDSRFEAVLNRLRTICSQ